MRLIKQLASHLRRDRQGIVISVQAGCDSSWSAARREYRGSRHSHVCSAVFAKNIATPAWYIRRTARFTLNFALQSGARRCQKPPRGIKTGRCRVFLHGKSGYRPYGISGNSYCIRSVLALTGSIPELVTMRCCPTLSGKPNSSTDSIIQGVLR